MREFESGATRDTEDGKLDYEGFLSPAVLQRFAEYMHEHRLQKDGTLRDSDNWQKGMPRDVYIKSMWRHFMDLWLKHRWMLAGNKPSDTKTLEDALCALLFNVQGYLYEVLKTPRAASAYKPTVESPQFVPGLGYLVPPK